jgi:hypothetical protein
VAQPFCLSSLLYDAKGAVEQYEKTEGIYRQIIKDPASDLMKQLMNRNAYALWQVLRSHADLVRQIGQPAAAAALEREAAGITVEAGSTR